jgi:hypothetical protein
MLTREMSLQLKLVEARRQIAAREATIADRDGQLERALDKVRLIEGMVVGLAEDLA